MAQTIKLKRSSVQNNTPSVSDLELGELAINTHDGKLFIKKDDGSASIVEVGGIVGTSSLTDGSVTTTKLANNAVTSAKLANNSVGVTQLNVSDGTNGQVLTTNGSGTLSFATVSGGSGQANQNSFSNVAVTGQNTIVADGTTDTLNLTAGSGIQLTTNATSDTLTITSTATGSVTEAFKTIAVSGQNNVVADSATDTLTFVAGSNMTITTNDSNDTITFASSGGGASGNTGGIDSQIFNGDGTDTTFTLTTAPTSEDHLWVFIDGVYQNKDSYSISGTTLTMGTAPDNGTKLAVHHVRVGTPGNGAITGAMLASGLSLSGDFAVDTNVLKVDSTNNRVGINITSPSEALDVNGSMGLAGELKLVTAIRHANSGAQVIDNDDNTYLKLNDPEGAGRLWLGDSGDPTNIYRNTTHKFVNADVSTEYMRINSTGIGIGTTSPSVSLDVGSKTDAIKIPVGTTAQRPSAAAGLFRYNSTDGQFEGYTDQWGAIAGSGSGSSSNFLVQELTGDGTTTAFTLSKTVTSEDNLIVFNEGVFQRKDSYAANNTTITFDTAPASSNKIVVYQMETGVVGIAPKIDTMTGDGSDTTLTLTVAPASENQTIVNIDGVTQHKATYSVSGTTLTFSSPPPNGSAVECITLTNMSVTTIGDNDLDTKIHFDETADDDVIRFDTGGTERMVIGGTGKVGIGITNPTGKLHIKTETDSGFTHGLVVERNNASDKGYINYQGGAFRMVATDGDPLKFGHASNNNRFEIGASGDAIFSGALTVAGDLNITGDINSASVTDLDVTDKTITLGKGQSEALSGGSGIVIDGSAASMLWDEANDEFDFNKGLNTAGTLKVSSYDTELASGHLRFKFNGGAYIDNNTTGQSLNFRVSNSSSIDTTAMTISSAGNVGIGTNNPDAKLNIAHSSDNLLTIQNNTYQGSGQNTEVALRFKATSSSDDERAKAGILLKNDGSAYGRGDLHFLVDSNDDNGNAVLADSKMVITHEGNVGIGSNSPSHTLDVTAGATAASSIRVDGGHASLIIDRASTSYDSNLTFQTNGVTKWRLWNNSNDTTLAIRDEANTADVMTWETGGNVGIGTGNPTTKLHLHSDDAKAFLLERDSASNAANLNEFSTNYSLSILNRTSGSYLNFGGNSSYSALQATDGAGTATAKNIVLNAHGGNVAIGTTSPQRDFDVRKSLNIFGSGGYTELMLRGRAGTAQNLGAFHLSIRGDVGGNNDDLKILRFTGGNSPSYAGIAAQMSNTNGHLALGTNASPSSNYLLLAEGKVQVKTASSGASADGSADELVVEGSGHSGLSILSGTSSYGTILFGDSDDSAAGRLRYEHNNNQLNFGTNGSWDRMIINSSGNVGIGNSSPSSYSSSSNNLVVGTSGDTGITIVSGTVSNGQLKFADGTSGDATGRGIIDYNHAADSMAFKTAATERMRIDAEGALNFSNSSVSFNSNNKTFAHTNNFQYFIGGSNGLYLADNYDLSNAIGIRDANYIDFSTSGAERMRIESTGPIIPDGSLGLEQYRPIFTGANAASYTTTTNLAYTKTSTQYIATGEHFKAKVRARAYTRYVHMKTNLASNNIMFFFRINGYFYNYGVNESVRGGYTYNDGVIAEHVQNTYNSNSNFTISDFYRSSTGNFLCLKLELQHSNYTEGEALVYFSSHTPSITRDLQITDMQHRNDETNAY